MSGPELPARPTARASWARGPFGLDLLACGAALALAALAFAVLPSGSPLRLLAALPVLFVVPGYLLIEAAAGPARSASAAWVRALAALGLSPPLVGLLALATAIVPGGFRPVPIVVALGLASLVLAGIAAWRRQSPRPLPAADADPLLA